MTQYFIILYFNNSHLGLLFFSFLLPQSPSESVQYFKLSLQAAKSHSS